MNVRLSIYLLLSCFAQIVWPAAPTMGGSCDPESCQAVRIGDTSLAIPQSYVGGTNNDVLNAAALVLHWPDFDGAYAYDDRKADPKLGRNNIFLVIEDARRIPSLQDQLKNLVNLYKATKPLGTLYGAEAFRSENSIAFIGTILIDRHAAEVSTFVFCPKLEGQVQSCDMYYRKGQLALQVGFASLLLPHWSHIKAQVSARIQQFISH